MPDSSFAASIERSTRIISWFAADIESWHDLTVSSNDNILAWPYPTSHRIDDSAIAAIDRKNALVLRIEGYAAYIAVADTGTQFTDMTEDFDSE